LYHKNYICGHVIETTILERVNGAALNWRKLDKDMMINIETGEVKEIQHNSNRDSKESLRQTIKKLRMIINANFFGAKNELFITLTYAENMQDTKRLYKDFDKFMKKLKRRFKDLQFEYIACVEPQERGAWHVHLLLKADVEELYIENELIAELWGQGFTKTQRLLQVDNVGAYLSAYLINDGDKKGQRLYYYPAGVNIYRCSKGIRRPKVLIGDMCIDNKHKVYEKTYDIVADDEVVNKVTIRQYNLMRDVGGG